MGNKGQSAQRQDYTATHGDMGCQRHKAVLFVSPNVLGFRLIQQKIVFIELRHVIEKNSRICIDIPDEKPRL